MGRNRKVFKKDFSQCSRDFQLLMQLFNEFDPDPKEGFGFWDFTAEPYTLRWVYPIDFPYACPDYKKIRNKLMGRRRKALEDLSTSIDIKAKMRWLAALFQWHMDEGVDGRPNFEAWTKEPLNSEHLCCKFYGLEHFDADKYLTAVLDHFGLTKLEDNMCSLRKALARFRKLEDSSLESVIATTRKFLGHRKTPRAFEFDRSHYLHRREYIDDIAKALAPNEPKEALCIFVLHGLQGMGKTMIAREYASLWDGPVLWCSLREQSVDTALRGIMHHELDIAFDCYFPANEPTPKQKRQQNDLKRSFSEQPTLLIIDNADSDNLSHSSELKERSHPLTDLLDAVARFPHELHILLTTREPKPSDVTKKKDVKISWKEVVGFTESEALQLLIKFDPEKAAIIWINKSFGEEIHRYLGCPLLLATMFPVLLSNYSPTNGEEIVPIAALLAQQNAENQHPRSLRVNFRGLVERALGQLGNGDYRKLFFFLQFCGAQGTIQEFLQLAFPQDSRDNNGYWVNEALLELIRYGLVQRSGCQYLLHPIYAQFSPPQEEKEELYSEWLQVWQIFLKDDRLQSVDVEQARIVAAGLMRLFKRLYDERNLLLCELADFSYLALRRRSRLSEVLTLCQWVRELLPRKPNNHLSQLKVEVLWSSRIASLYRDLAHPMERNQILNELKEKLELALNDESTPVPEQNWIRGQMFRIRCRLASSQALVYNNPKELVSAYTQIFEFVQTVGVDSLNNNLNPLLQRLAWLSCRGGNPQLFEEIYKLYLKMQVGDPQIVTPSNNLGHYNFATILLNFGDLTQGLPLLQEIENFREAQKHDNGMSFPFAMRAYVDLQQGKIQEAFQHSAKALDISDRMEARTMLYERTLRKLKLAAEVTNLPLELEGIKEELLKLQDEIMTSAPPIQRPNYYRLLTELCFRLGQHQEAKSSLGKAIEHSRYFPAQMARTLCLHAKLVLKEGERAQAYAYLIQSVSISFDSSLLKKEALSSSDKPNLPWEFLLAISCLAELRQADGCNIDAYPFWEQAYEWADKLDHSKAEEYAKHKQKCLASLNNKSSLSPEKWKDRFSSLAKSYADQLPEPELSCLISDEDEQRISKFLKWCHDQLDAKALENEDHLTEIAAL